MLLRTVPRVPMHIYEARQVHFVLRTMSEKEGDPTTPAKKLQHLLEQLNPSIAN
jgi:hypothetical protein